LLSRRNARQQFKRELIVGRREDRTRLLDEAAKLRGEASVKSVLTRFERRR
jgi:hypothetical protein